MSIEEKAKAYDIAIEKAKEWKSGLAGNDNIETCINELFPQLVESEDEKIRKELLRFITICDESDEKELQPYSKWIGWLEKQGEQKPEWSEEDEKMFEHIIEKATLTFSEWNRLSEKEINFLKSLRPHKQKIWTEKDEQLLENCIALIEDVDCTEEEQHWLKNLRMFNPEKKLSLEKLTEGLEKASIEWDKNASFTPISMIMDGNRPIGTKEHITTHKESFKRGVEWILNKLKDYYD